MSAGMLVFAGALVVSATGAFFSDVETSTGNTFAAGAIDLLIDNSSYGFDWNDPTVQNPTGVWGPNQNNSWSLSDLTNQLFFSFGDLKPGDYGEDTISIHVNDNDSWACMAMDLTGTPENGLTEPEALVDQTVGADEGELQNYLSFLFWNDDGDNVLEVGEDTIPALSGPAGSIFGGQWLAIADSAGGQPLPGETTRYIGKGWCFGNIAADPVAQGDYGAPTANNTGFTCSGAGDHNNAQTDGISVDVSFYAVQSRNNSDFLCSSLPPLQGVPPVIEVGAALGDFVEAPVCTDTVAVGNSIQEAIDANGPGSTICVGPGTHVVDTYPLRVNEDNMTLISTDGPGATTLNGGVILDNDGTQVSGFSLTSSTLLGETFGVYINTGADNVEVSFNDMTGPGVGSGRGVVNAIGVTNALIANNEITNYLTGVFLNPSSNMIVELNDLVSNGVGSGNDNPTNNTVRFNQITGNTTEGVGVFSNGAESIEVNFNNIFGNGGPGNELNSYAVDTVDAENNWWGDLTPADEIGGVGVASVDFTPFANAVYAQN